MVVLPYTRKEIVEYITSVTGSNKPRDMQNFTRKYTAKELEQKIKEWQDEKFHR
jgi:hypothetical protein